MSFLYWRAQKWTQHSRCGLHSAEQRGRIISIKLLAMSFLMQPRVLLAFFASRHTAGLCSSSCPPGPPGPSLPSCFPDSWPLACTSAWGYSSPGVGHGSPIQQQTHIFPSLPSAAYGLVEALLVAFHVPCQIQLQMSFGFTKSTPACSVSLYSIWVTCLVRSSSYIHAGLLLSLLDFLLIKTDHS